jgi:pyrophosphate--fructose-6-phosphate 1-phosphotransferase
MSACKYWHFVKLMGRAASHVTLEASLQCHPNVTIVSEEVAAKAMTLEQVVDSIVDVVVRRSEAGKNYGVLLVPEGLIEFIPDIKVLIGELSNLLGKDEEYIKSLPDHSERLQYISSQLSDASAKVYGSLPTGIQEVLLRRDSHGNVPLSQIETERLLIDLVSDRLRLMKSQGTFNGKFSPLNHFLGYEGRCAAPSNFDADYCYSLGYTATQLVRGGLTGYTVTVQNTTKSSDEWIAGGVPVTMMLNMEVRKGKAKPVIKKALTELEGAPFKMLAKNREAWALEDAYSFPGPIQYFGPSEVADRATLTLQLERGK